MHQAARKFRSRTAHQSPGEIVRQGRRKSCNPGGRFGGCYNPKFELGRDLCTVHLPLKLHRPVFTHLEVMLTNKHTHKQTDAAENIQRSSLRYDVG